MKLTRRTTARSAPGYATCVTPGRHALLDEPTGRVLTRLVQQVGEHLPELTGGLFDGNAKECSELLGELYDLRSYAAHMNDFEAALTYYPEGGRNRVGSPRAYPAELLASDAYARILKSPTLRQNFESDASIDAFWARTRQDQVAVWGPPTELLAAETDRFEFP